MIVSRSRIGPPVPEVDGGATQGGADAPRAAPGVISWKRPADLVPVDAPADGADTKQSQPAGTGKDAQGNAAVPAGAGRKINVNKASAAELELLPDVGPATAKRIIEHRTKHGAFKVLSDLDKVSGIGPKTLEKLKDRVVFADPPAPR